MNRHDRLRILVDSFFYFVRIDLKGLGVGIGKNRQGAGTDNYVVGGNERVRGNNNLIADPNIEYV